MPILPPDILDTLESDVDLLRPVGNDQPGDPASPLDLLLGLIEANERGHLADPAAVDWLKHGLTQYMTGDEKSLAVALGLPRKNRQAHRRSLRLFFLREAWDRMERAWPERSVRANALALAEEIQRLEQHWPKFSMLAEPDPHWSTVRKALWRARRFSTGPLPQLRQLLRIFSLGY